MSKVKGHRGQLMKFPYIKGNTKFWEILKIGLIVNLYNFDIFGCPCGCIIRD